MNPRANTANEITGESYGIMTSPDAVRLERLLPGPIERVWSYLAESEQRTSRHYKLEV